MDERSQLRALLEGVEGHEYDEVFSRLAHGELSEGEEEALRTSGDPEIRRLYELFRPMDDEAKRRFEQIVAQAFAKQTTSQQQPAGRQSAPSARPSTRRLRRFIRIGLPLAAAAGLLVWFIAEGPLRRAGRPEPPSALQFFPGDRPVERSESGSVLLGESRTGAREVELPAGACWKLQLGLLQGGRLPAETKAYFVRENSAVPWPVTFHPLQNGRMEPEGGCAKLPALSAGRWELKILSGSQLPELDPAAAANACKSEPPPGATWRCDNSPYPIRILPPPTESP